LRFDPALQNLTGLVKSGLICSVVSLGVPGSMNNNVNWNVGPADVADVLILPNLPMIAGEIDACKQLSEAVTWVVRRPPKPCMDFDEIDPTT
jgi:hypothetical protein